MGEKLLADEVYDCLKWHGPVLLTTAVAARDLAVYLAEHVFDVDEYQGKAHYAMVAEYLTREINRALRNNDSIVGVCEWEDDSVLLAAMRKYASNRSNPIFQSIENQVEARKPTSAQQLQELVAHFSKTTPR